MTIHHYRQGFGLWSVDVFTDRPLSGNPLGVVFEADDLAADVRQAIARETNLSETVFLSRPKKGGDFALHIHTVRREIPFAVHPAIGAAHAFAEAAGQGARRLVLECGTGLVVAEQFATDGWFVRVPDGRFAPTSVTAAEVADWLGLPPSRIVTQAPLVVHAGVPWLMIELASVSDLGALVLDHKAIAQATRANRAVGITVYARSDIPGIAARMRSFAPAEGIFEDPVCGSCASALAALLRRDDPFCAAAPRLSFEQGNEISRHGMVHSIVLPDGQAVGGQAVTVMHGRIHTGA